MTMPLLRLPEPFSDPDWLFELKLDGFRALAYVGDGDCGLISRNGISYSRFGDLARSIGHETKASTAILDGEIVVLGQDGRALFNSLMFARGTPRFYAFDVLYLDGVDLRELPLVERKKRLKKVVPDPPSHLLYLDHIEAQGEELFRLVCEQDLEGIVAKPKASPYLSDSGPSLWVKIKNPSYSQAEGRHEPFERRG